MTLFLTSLTKQENAIGLIFFALFNLFLIEGGYRFSVFEQIK